MLRVFLFVFSITEYLTGQGKSNISPIPNRTFVCGDYHQQFSEAQHQHFRDMLRQQCKKTGAENKTEEVEAVIKNFVECVTGLFNIETLQMEIEEAKPNGALDEVFKKYCDKSAELKTCIHKLSVGVAPCLDTGLRVNLPAANNATDQLIDFLCYKDGDRIALFIAEGGPECFQEKSGQIRDCANKLKEGVNVLEPSGSFNLLFETDHATGKNLSLEQQCIKYDELTSCVVAALEGCSATTPGNMAESLFRFIRNGSPCPKKN